MGALRASAGRRGAGFRLGGGLLLLVVLSAAALIGSAHAAPSTKNYTANVHVTDATQSLSTFTVTLTNDRRSNQTFGSANVTLPPGFSATAASTSRPGWTATAAGSVIQLRSTSNAVAASQSIVVSVTIDPNSITGCTNAAWAVDVKQSNDFNGTNNFFTMLAAGSDLTPLGSFVFAPIETVLPGDVHVPQIVVGTVTHFSVTALDTCGKPDSDYSGATLAPSPTALNPSPILTAADFSGPSWSGGGASPRVGAATVTPTDVEVADQAVVTDPQTQISATSNSFDVVEKICAVSGSTCVWSNKKGTITATSTVGTSNGNTASLGLGFRSVGAVCNIAGKDTSSVGDLIQIVPLNYAAGGTYTVTLTYAKTLAPNGPASGFNVCKNQNPNGDGDWVPVAQCGKTPVAPCVLPTKVSGGALQVTLYLEPGDPLSGGFG